MFADRDADNPHTERLPWCSLVYWRDGVAARRSDAWTHCDVQVHQFPAIRFDRTQERERNDFAEALRQAYERGRSDKAREFRKVLDCAP